MNTAEKLEKLAELMNHRDLVAINKKELIDKTIPVEVRIMVNDIDFEFGEKTNALQAEIDKLTAEIKDDVLRLGGTVKGEYMMAVYNKPRVSWDTKALDAMASFIPNINEAKKVGEPSVTIRTV
jgi:hypothetical protein